MKRATPDSVSLKFLQTHVLFRKIEGEALINVLSLMRQENFPEGWDIVKEGDSGDCLYLIVKGSVEILKGVQTPEEVLWERIATLEEGETFGEMAVIDLLTRSATVRTLEETIVLTLSHTDLLYMLKAHPLVYTTILRNLACEVSHRLRTTDVLFAISLFSKKREERDKS